MIIITTQSNFKNKLKIRCPQCRSRICDIVADDLQTCRKKYRVVLGEFLESGIAVKCQKCGCISVISNQLNMDNCTGINHLD